jgi:hypothetical protein
MSEMLDYEGNHPDGVRAICPQCETVVLKDSERAAQNVVETHNDQRHDGGEVAGVCAWDLEPLITDEMDIGTKVAVMNALDDDLSREDQRKVLGLVGE